MRFRKSLAVIFLGLGCAAAAQAQAGVYIGYTATRFSGIPCFEFSPVACGNGAKGGVPGSNGLLGGEGTGSVNPSGVQGGAYYDFRTIGPMRLGVDLRGGDYHSNKSATSAAGGKNATGYDNVMLGLRGSFHTHYSWLNPYVQVSAGYSRSNATEPFLVPTLSATSIPPPRVEDNFVQYEGFAGLNVHVFPFIDLRPIEVGIGNMNRIGAGAPTPSGSTIPADGPGSVRVTSIGASIVFHLPSSQ